MKGQSQQNMNVRARRMINDFKARAIDEGAITLATDRCAFNSLNRLGNNIIKGESVIVLPNSYKDGKLLLTKPDDGTADLDCTRGSIDYGIDADGNSQRMPYNYVNNSEDLSNLEFTQFDNGIDSVTTNAGTSPLGTNTANLVTEDTTNDGHYLRFNLLNTIGIRTISVFIKQNSANRGVRLAATNGNSAGVGFNFDTESLELITGTGYIDSGFSDEGNGWFRLWLTYNGELPIISGRLFFSIYNLSDGTVYLGDGSSVYMWGAQINDGYIKPYLQTNGGLDTPNISFPFGGSINGCPRLSCLPERTNLIASSNDVTDAMWFKENLTPVFDGEWTELTDTVDGSPENHGVLSDVVTLYSNDAEMSFYEVWLKDVTNFQYFLISSMRNIAPNFDDPSFSMTFDLDNLTVTEQMVFFDPHGFIEKHGDVYRIGFWISSTSSGSGFRGMSFAISPTATPEADGVDSLKYQGVGDKSFKISNIGLYRIDQVYFESPILTSGTAETRLIQNCIKTGMSSKIGQSKGTIFFDINIENILPDSPNISRGVFAINDGTTDDDKIEVIISLSGTVGRVNRFEFSSTSGGVGNGSMISNFKLERDVNEGRYKGLIVYDYVAGVQKFFMNGSLMDTDNNTTAFSNPLDRVEVGTIRGGTLSLRDSYNVFEHEKDVMISDAKAIQITKI